MSDIVWIVLAAVVGVVAGLLIGVHNPTIAAATAKVAADAKSEAKKL